MNKPQVKLDPKYRILPEHTDEERQVLEEAIRTTGRIEPPILDEELNVLDGFARVEIAEKLRMPYTTTIIPSLTEAEKHEYIILTNLARRHLDREQRRELAALLRQDRKSLIQIANLLGVSKSQVHRDLADAPGMPETVIGTDGSQHPTHKPKAAVLCKNLNEARKSAQDLSTLDPTDIPCRVFDARGIAKLARKVGCEKRDAELVATYDPEWYDGTNDANTVERCDINYLGLDPESVDMIFTDPPYDEEAVPLYGLLAVLAKHVLKPGGMCIVYAGNWHLPRVMDLLGKHLEYLWTFTEFHPQSEQRVYERHV